MSVIYKYPFAAQDHVRLFMPLGAEVLCVQMQGEQPCIWAKVDPSSAMQVRTFELRGTGHELGAVGKYLGTFQMLNGGLVFHLFDSVAT